MLEIMIFQCKKDLELHALIKTFILMLWKKVNVKYYCSDY